MHRFSGVLAALAVILLGVAATFAVFAQVALPFVSVLSLQDAVAVIPRGSPSAQSSFATPAQIAGQENYLYQAPVTAFTLVDPNFVSLLYLNPAGTLATGTLTMMANPSDGQKFCLQDTQTQTAITIQANTGQTLAAGTFGLATPTALVANTRYCWLFLGPLSTWTRTL